MVRLQKLRPQPPSSQRETCHVELIHPINTFGFDSCDAKTPLPLEQEEQILFERRRLLHQHLEDLGRHTGAPHLTVVVLAGLMCEAAVLYRHFVRFSVCVVLPLAAFFFIFHLYLHPIMAGTDRRYPVIPKLPNDQKQVS